MVTVTLRQSGGNYSTLAAAMSSRTADGDTISIEGTWTVDDTTVATNSFSTTVTTDASSKNPGYVPIAPSHYRLRNTSGHSITLSDSLTMTGVDIGSQSTGVSDEIFRVNAANVTLTATDSLFWFNARTDQQDIVYSNNQTGLTVDFVNCGAWNAYRAVVDIFDTNASTTHTVNLNSVHIYDCGFSKVQGDRSGIVGVTSSNAIVINVNVFNSALHVNTASLAFSGDADDVYTVVANDVLSSTTSADFTDFVDTETLTNIVYSNTWTAGTPGAGSIVAVNDITGGAMDLRLQDDTNNDAQDNHSNASGAGLTMPGTDIAATSRPQNTTYDIGFFEVVAGGAPSKTLLQMTQLQDMNKMHGGFA